MSQSIESVYRDLKAQAHAARAHFNEVRQFAWRVANPHVPGCWDFWRHGFLSRFGRRVERAGYVGIPRYDIIAQEVAWHFPEYGTDDGTDRLWDLLLSPYDRLPSRDQLLREAREIVSTRKGADDESPF